MARRPVPGGSLILYPLPRPWRGALCVAALALAGGCEPTGPTGDPFDAGGNVTVVTPTPEPTPTPTATEAPPTATPGTPTPTPTATVPQSCAPEVEADSSEFKLTFDEDLVPYVRYLVHYTLRCGEIVGGRVAVEVEGPDHAEEVQTFLTEENALVSIDEEAGTFTLDVPVEQDPAGDYLFSLTLFDSLGHGSEPVTGGYVPDTLETASEE